MSTDYSEEHIKTLEPREQIRLRPGMYIGKLGDGSSQDDGIYVLLKEVMDNAIDEYMMGNGKKIDVLIAGREVRVRDYGRGIPLGKALDVVTKIFTGAKYDSKTFKKSVGQNGVGIKAVNALSDRFILRSFRDGQVKELEFKRGITVNDYPAAATDEENGVEVIFEPDEEMFGNYFFISEYVEAMIKNYVYLNAGLLINFNETKYVSRNGLADLLNENMSKEGLYPLIHLKGDDIEMAFTHGLQYGEDYYSFVNGQNTTQGGTHLIAFREALVKTFRDFYKKDFEPADIRSSIVAAISIKVEEPIFESQTKTKLGSKDMAPGGQSVRNFISEFIKKRLDDFLHKNSETAKIILKKIQDAEKERKEISSIQKLAKEKTKKVSLHNKKLRDCRIHYNTNDSDKLASTIFITEGDSASGSITKSRSVETQAVFSLRGKPLNSFGLTKKIVYENEEFNLLQAALNIEEGIENLRYNNVIIATDADVDGMHIRLLLLTFFLQFFPDLVRKGHVYILQTPLFRVRNKKETKYCYTPNEKLKAIKILGPNPEITRFKGLGEISPDEFKHFIGKDMRLEPVRMKKTDAINGYLEFFMGKNTPERQDFIIQNLRVEEDKVESVETNFF
jgi:topoisomerase-4 subunit B